MTDARPEDYVRAFRNWPSGVAIVASHYGDEPRGMTVSSLTSVSREPPLVSVACDLGARTLEAIRTARGFGVTILSREQSELSRRFADRALELVRFDEPAFQLGHNGCPLFHGGLVHLECSVEALYAAGDHELVLGRVTRVETFPGTPLVYCAGGYRELDELRQPRPL